MDVTAIDSNSLTRNSIIITKLSEALLKSANIIPDILVKAITENKQNPVKLDGVHQGRHVDIFSPKQMK